MALQRAAAGALLRFPSHTTTRSSADDRTPADDFAPLAAVFRRRLLAGAGTAALVALGANFAGVTSFLLGFYPDLGRRLKLDALYPVGGYSRCLEPTDGFEFLYPSSWVGDQTLLYRAAERAEAQRQLEYPSSPLADAGQPQRPRRRLGSVSEPVVALGPPGSNGELNVSVIVSSVPLDFSIEAFGGPKEVGEAVLRTITAGSRRGADVTATLVDSAVRRDPAREQVDYYKLEFQVESLSFRRHNVAVCSAYGGKLFTLNAQAPESKWPAVREELYTIADSFRLTFS
ncbi:hypothetical protein Taro_004283 [Colocasia esculenta]|uniref:PsbP C-terminal domain-containing protein n=1 Tax=Colocasia esculenta TaxID=4460 RepID=A0A843TR89_COLES|nr:hypothetical protein [Colocasia esculenta]